MVKARDPGPTAMLEDMPSGRPRVPPPGLSYWLGYGLL